LREAANFFVVDRALLRAMLMQKARTDSKLIAARFGLASRAERPIHLEAIWLC